MLNHEDLMDNTRTTSNSLIRDDDRVHSNGGLLFHRYCHLSRTDPHIHYQSKYLDRNNNNHFIHTHILAHVVIVAIMDTTINHKTLVTKSCHLVHSNWDDTKTVGI
eukprot:741974_1